MATSHAETGTIASQAGADTGGHAANVETEAAAPQAGAVGAADVAGPEAPKPAAEAPKTDAKTPKSDTKKPKTDAKTKESTAKVADAAKKLFDTALDEAGKQVAAEDTTKIKMLRSHPDFAYHAGETGELPTEKAEFLIAGGFAQAVGTPKADEAED